MTKKVTVEELRANLSERLEPLKDQITNQDRIKIAAALGIDPMTVRRYISDLDYGRIEVAEQVVEQLEKISEEKQNVPS